MAEVRMCIVLLSFLLFFDLHLVNELKLQSTHVHLLLQYTHTHTHDCRLHKKRVSYSSATRTIWIENIFYVLENKMNAD